MIKHLKRMAIDGLVIFQEVGTDVISLNKTGTSKNGWEKQGITWYYYENGKVALGWKKINGSWYYFQTSGAMRTGWLKDGSKWYYLKSSGEMQTGWLKDKGIWYYLEAQVL